jgi:hypothetical protein
MVRSHILLRWGFAILIAGGAPLGLCAQEAAEKPAESPIASQPTVPPKEGEPQPVDLQQILPRLKGPDKDLVERRIKSGSIATEKADQKSLALVEAASLVSVYHGANPNPRVLVLKVVLVNLTAQPVAVQRDAVQLIVDGAPQTPKDAPPQFQQHSFQIGQQGYALKSAQMPPQVSVAPYQ